MTWSKLPAYGRWGARGIEICLIVSAFLRTGHEFDPRVTPVNLTAAFEHPANDWRPAIRLTGYRVGKKIEYDGKAGRVTNCEEANALLGKQYRPGWPPDG